MQDPIVIVGAGLAGVCAAWGTLGQAPVLLADHGSPRAASEAALVGMANPLMSRRANLVWRTGPALEALEQFTSDIGASPLYRGLLRTAADWNQMEALRARAQSHPELASWFDAAAAAERWPWLHAPMGVVEVLQGGAYDIPDMRKRALDTLSRRGVSIRQDWRLTGWTETTDSVVAKFDSPEGPRVVPCGRLILAMGAGVDQIPELTRLKLHPVKGQLARLTPNSMPAGVKAVSGGGYMIPVGDGVIIGSSYEHEFDSIVPERPVTLRLIERACTILPWLKDAEIDSEHAGIRVTVPDTRLPMVGPIPDSEGVWIFSGLGSKGLLTAPMMGRELAGWLQKPETVPGELRIRTW